ncbi:hypothetical protein K505DRAFT_366384 [Melanomma pulvis-pyrius CBS 109.77]|uniref:Uncharacterized protein n=1 Tax=Melanomma pulvis-pyrius CBS 109.77 TaxID=1314802 RepID=A0A6A6WX78_9PLEO|nr:hypothetical protein K505DRAFT_366384 [Melanomma pulvis-pyrius CBS 109.77]
MIPSNSISDPGAFAEEMSKAYEAFKADNKHGKGFKVFEAMDVVFRDLINDTQSNPVPEQGHDTASIRDRFIKRMLPLMVQNNKHKNASRRVLLPLELMPSIDFNAQETPQYTHFFFAPLSWPATTGGDIPTKKATGKAGKCVTGKSKQTRRKANISATTSPGSLAKNGSPENAPTPVKTQNPCRTSKATDRIATSAPTPPETSSISSDSTTTAQSETKRSNWTDLYQRADRAFERANALLEGRSLDTLPPTISPSPTSLKRSATAPTINKATTKRSRTMAPCSKQPLSSRPSAPPARPTSPSPSSPHPTNTLTEIHPHPPVIGIRAWINTRPTAKWTRSSIHNFLQQMHPMFAREPSVDRASPHYGRMLARLQEDIQATADCDNKRAQEILQETMKEFRSCVKELYPEDTPQAEETSSSLQEPKGGRAANTRQGKPRHSRPRAAAQSGLTNGRDSCSKNPAATVAGRPGEPKVEATVARRKSRGGATWDGDKNENDDRKKGKPGH